MVLTEERDNQGTEIHHLYLEFMESCYFGIHKSVINSLSIHLAVVVIAAVSC